MSETVGLRVAKADEEDIKSTREFLQACELFWDSRPAYSFVSKEDQWLSWENDDPEKMELLKIRKRISEEDGVDEEDVDNRLVLFEFIKRRYKKADSSWGRVIMAADCLIDNCCDPMQSHLAFYPGFVLFHVVPEQ